MLEPYENILIGNFLFGFGLAMGHRSEQKAPAGCINLLQQTPLDRPLGDVLVHYPGVMRLIEFKRTRGDVVKESTKLTILNAALSPTPRLRQVSRAVHWFIQSRDAVPEFDVTVRPYLDLHSEEAPSSTLAGFTQCLADEASGRTASGFTPLELSEYLNTVLTYGASKVGSGTSSGLLVSVGEDGWVRYVAVEDICDLRLSAQKVFEMQRNRARGIEAARLQALRQRSPDLSPEQDRNQFERELEIRPPSRGFSR